MGHQLLYFRPLLGFALDLLGSVLLGGERCASRSKSGLRLVLFGTGAGGDQASKYRVAILTSRMARSQVVAAQEQASEWLRRHQMLAAKPAFQR